MVADTSGALHPETLRLLYDFARLKTDAAEQHAVANSLRSPLTPEQLCQRRGATFARLRMEAQLYSLRASATRLTGKHWATPYAHSLLPRSRARAWCGVGAFTPAPAAHVLASRQWCEPGTFSMRVFYRGLPAPALHCFSLCNLRLLSVSGCFSLGCVPHLRVFCVSIWVGSVFWSFIAPSLAFFIFRTHSHHHLASLPCYHVPCYARGGQHGPTVSVALPQPFPHRRR